MCPDDPLSPGPTPADHQRTTGGHFRWKPPTAERLQELLMGYEVLEMLGAGGMGAVYKARQVSLDRMVAIKILPPEAVDDEMNFVERFRNEARTMARMSHPGIVGVFDFGATSEGQLYIVMEYIDGTDVAKMIMAQGRLPADYALAITAHVCDALAYAHKHGVVHRDIKPANILINMAGQVKVADFGLAKASDAGQSGLTKTNMAMGTPDYVAPEALMAGMNVDGRADLYAVGVMLFNMLTGNIPRGMFRMPSVSAATDPRFDDIIVKAMESDREMRYQTADEVRRDLDVILSTPMVKAGGLAAAAVPELPQKPVAKGPQKRPAPSTGVAQLPAQAPAPAPKKSSLAPVLGIAATVLLAAGGYVFFKPAPPPAMGEARPSAPPVGEVKKAAAPAPKPLSPPPSPSSPTNSPATAKRSLAATGEVAKPTIDKGMDGDPKILRKDTPSAPAPKSRTDGSVDLLALADVKRDARSGLWTSTPEGFDLRAETFGALEFPAEVPEEYDFEIEFTPKNSGNNVNQYITAQGRSFAWKLNAHGRVPPIYGFELLDGKFTKDNKEAVTVLNKTLEAGKRYRSTIEVRKGSLRALVDGEEVLKWSGDFSRFSMETGIKMNDPKHVGIGAYKRAVLFHSAVLRPVDVKVPMVAVPPPMATPAPAPVTANDAVAERLATLEKQFFAIYDRDAGTAYKAALAKLDASYTGALERALTTATQGGKLDEAVALRDEKQRLTSGQGVPPADLETLPESLKAMRATYRQALAKLQDKRDKSADPLYTFYDQALARYEAELTQQSKIDDAVRVRTKRDEVRRQKPKVDSGAAASAPATGLTKGSAPAPKAAETLGRSRWHEAARWIVSMGGNLRVEKNGQQTGVDEESEIPPGKFEVVSITLAGGPKTADVKDDDFTRLSGLGIRYLRLSKLGISEAAFAFLPTTPDLEKMFLDEMPGVGDGLFTHMAPLQKLTEFEIQTAPKITGEGIEKLACLPLLRTTSFFSTAFNDAGANGIAGAKVLESLRLENTRITDEGLRVIGSLPQLNYLTVRNCRNIRGATFAAWENKSSIKRLIVASCPLVPEAFAAIGSLTQLTELAVDFTPSITDETLKSWAALTKLKRLDLPGTRVTGTGFAALRGCAELKHLNLSGNTPITAAGLTTIVENVPQLANIGFGSDARLTPEDYRILAQLKALTHFEASVPAVNDAVLAEISLISTLESVVLNSSSVTAEGLRKLRPLKSLTRMILGSCKALDDTAIPDLQAFKTLKTLDLYRCPITPEGLATLKKALPGCNVNG